MTKRTHTPAYSAERRLQENEFDEYIGIQRRLSPSRTKELKKYVCTEDATFPTAVILAVNSDNAIFDEDAGVLKLVTSEGKQIYDVASILDGQHRVAGLTALDGRGFDVSVSVFVGADVATQANIFATVNLAQQK
jgi:DGQHR domain-containing protein